MSRQSAKHMNFECIDFHAHPIPDSFVSGLKELGIDPIEEDGFPLPKWSLQDHLQFMKDAGITHTVLTLPTPHIHNGEDEKAARAARLINNEMASYAKQDPEHFSFCACLPIPNVQGALEEIRYAAEELHCAGFKLPTNANGVYLGDPMLDPVMEELNRRRALCIIHPCRARQVPRNVITGKVMAIYEYPADTTRCVLNMIASHIMSRFPDITWVIPHTGSFLAYELQRFKGVSGILASLGMMEVTDVDAEVRNLYYDIAGDPQPHALDMLLKITDIDHIVYGSDWPHSPVAAVIPKKQRLESTETLPDILKKIYSENGERILRK